MANQITESSYDTAYLAHAEILANKRVECFHFFVSLYGITVWAQDDDNAWLRFRDYYEFHILKFIRYHTTGVGHIVNRASSETGLMLCVVAIQPRKYDLSGWQDNGQGHERALCFLDTLRNAFKIFYEIVCQQAEDAGCPSLKKLVPYNHEFGVSLLRLSHLNLQAAEVREFKLFLETCLASRASEVIQLDNGCIGSNWFTPNNKSYDRTCTREHGSGNGRMCHVTYTTDTPIVFLLAVHIFLKNSDDIENRPYQHVIKRPFVSMSDSWRVTAWS